MDDINRGLLRIIDGTASVSVSMLLAALLKVWTGAADWPVIGLLHQMTRWEDGVIIVATLLVLPTAVTLWGGAELFFLAREMVERRYRERGRKEGIDIGVVQGREEGIEIGLEKGRKEGREEGIEEGRRLERERIRQEESRQQGIEEGRRLERERIRQELREQGGNLTLD